MMQKKSQMMVQLLDVRKRILPLDDVDAELAQRVLEVEAEEGGLGPVRLGLAATTGRPLRGRARRGRGLSARPSRSRSPRPRCPAAAAILLARLCLRQENEDTRVQVLFYRGSTSSYKFLHTNDIDGNTVTPSGSYFNWLEVGE